ncbi:hypothetical protein QQ054_18090 [Oscillatoria amoena NRMC-F 0135]|nr:hypothetical protein [Oscillatoria amoena NRMC-F 0135]
MKKPIGVIAYLISALFAAAQNTPEEEVKAVIGTLFKGMQLGDSAMVRSTFSGDVQFATIGVGKDGVTFRHVVQSAAPFLNAVGTPHGEAWNEEIWNLKISIDGNLAQAWCDYAFYVGKRFSHCGADAFLLHKDKSGWKIFHLADTRRTSSCMVPKEIEEKYK